MTQKNSVKTLMGFGFVVVALFCVAAIFYFVKVKPEMERRKLEAASEQLASPVVVEEAANQEGGVDMASLLAESERVYGPAERDRKEGILWIDRQTPQYVVTLGALNGLSNGQTLDVYDGTRQVAQVTVDSPLDVISYVTPANKSISAFEYDYYRVVIK